MLLQAEGDAEQHRRIGPWQSLLGEPNWKRVDALGELGVAKLLEGRPGEAVESVSLEERTEVRSGCVCCCTTAEGRGWRGGSDLTFWASAVGAQATF